MDGTAMLEFKPQAFENGCWVLIKASQEWTAE
jgi:hypothetical protein